jgi:uncharacterized protein YpbB
VDARLKCFVVMNAVEKIHGKRGKTSLIKLLKGSHEYSVEKTVQEFDLIMQWGFFSQLDRQEIEDILTGLIDKGYVYIENVSFGSYSYPMVHISDEGKDVLLTLEETEAARMHEYNRDIFGRRINLEISKKGIALNGFLSHLSGFLQAWADSANRGLDFTSLLEQLDLDFASMQRIERFIYRLTPDKQKDQFRSRHTLDVTCWHLTKQMREFLGALPELEAVIFRHHFGLQDSMYRPENEILRYYGLMANDIHTFIKRIISRFANKSYVERFPFIRAVMEFLDNYPEEEFSASDPLVKDTSAVTYELYQQGLTITGIARERGLAVSTIYSHFGRLIPLYKLNLEDIVPEERITNILRAANETGAASLKSIKEQLSPDYNYGEIKLVIDLISP